MRILLLSVLYEDAREKFDTRAAALRDQGHDVEVAWIRVPRSRPGEPWPLRMLRMMPAYGRALAAAMSRKHFDMIAAPTAPPLIFPPVTVRSDTERVMWPHKLDVLTSFELKVLTVGFDPL